MQKIILLISFLVIGLSPDIFTQSVDVDWGQETELQKGTFIHKLVGYDDEGIYILRSTGAMVIDKNNLILEYYSLITQTIESSNEILMPSANGMETVFEDIFYLDKKLILFTSATDRTRMKRVLFAQYLRKDGSLKNRPKEVGALSVENIEKHGFNFSLTEDKSNIVIHYQRSFNEYNGEYFTFKILAPDLNMLFDKKLVFPPNLNEREFELTQYKIGNSGSIYMTIKAKIKTKRRSRRSKEQVERIILIFNPKKEQYQYYTLTLYKYFPADIVFGLDEDECMSIFGFFTSRSKNTPIGVFHNKLNPHTLKFEFNMERKDIYYKFARDEITDLKSPRLSEDPQYLYSYVPRDVVFLDNQASVFVAEHYYRTMRTMVDPKTKQETDIHYFYYNDLVTAKADKHGKIEWMNRIYKSQYSLDDSGIMSSYAITTDANKAKIIYNDNPSNLKSGNPDKIKTYKHNPYVNPKGMAIIVTLFSDGSVDKSMMFGKGEQKTVTCPRLFVTTKDHHIVHGQKGKKFKFGTFVFER